MDIDKSLIDCSSQNAIEENFNRIIERIGSLAFPDPAPAGDPSAYAKTYQLFLVVDPNGTTHLHWGLSV